jgi:hypothetical protein
MTIEPRSLPSPPELQLFGEFPAIIEPPLRDMQPFPDRGTIEQWEPFVSFSRDELLTSEFVARLQGIAISDERVSQLIENKRFVGIGASVLETRRKPEATKILYVFYNYDDNQAIEVSFDSLGERVIELVVSQTQPAPTSEEIDRVIAMARNDRRFAQLLDETLQGGAILVEPEDLENRFVGHRIFDVRFGLADERLPRYCALVDLSNEEVLKVGTCEA